jgi:hypothetical protein
MISDEEEPNFSAYRDILSDIFLSGMCPSKGTVKPSTEKRRQTKSSERHENEQDLGQNTLVEDLAEFTDVSNALFAGDLSNYGLVHCK